MIRCHKCGYSNILNAKKCIKCQNSLFEDAPSISNGMNTSIDLKFNKPPEVVKEDPKKTRIVNFQSSKSCQLIALGADHAEGKSFAIQGENTNLTRDFLGTDNNTISRKGHASIVARDGNWYIENLSDLKTTFIQVKGPSKLSDGDMIMLGDSLFKFKENS